MKIWLYETLVFPCVWTFDEWRKVLISWCKSLGIILTICNLINLRVLHRLCRSVATRSETLHGHIVSLFAWLCRQIHLLSHKYHGQLQGSSQKKKKLKRGGGFDQSILHSLGHIKENFP